tara:strand:+ start:259 stop:426 length:168 start_codon:yes stop_codon:yes gene_type:complete
MPSKEKKSDPSNREMIYKLDNDITLLRGEVLALSELVKQLISKKEKESQGWIFSS